jgi:hypothetical protein
MEFSQGPRVKHLGNSSKAKAKMKSLALLVGGLLLVMLLLAAGAVSMRFFLRKKW